MAHVMVVVASSASSIACLSPLSFPFLFPPPLHLLFLLPLLRELATVSAPRLILVGFSTPPPNSLLLLIDCGCPQAHFNRGMLVVNDVVAIVKSASGITVDGPLCLEYMAIRELLYSQFAVA